MTVNSKDVIEKDYILLDWNVIKYLKKPRGNKNQIDNEAKLIVDSLRRRYEFPFCEAHLRDLSKSYPSHRDLVDEDLCFLQSLTHSVALGTKDETGEFMLTYYDPKKLFNEIVSEPSRTPDISPDMGPQSSFQVDMQAMDPGNPLYNMLTESNGTYNPVVMSNWLNRIYEPFFSEAEPYKVFRNYITSLKRDLENSNSVGLNVHDLVYKEMLVQRMTPFVNSLEIDNEDDLSTIWKDAISEFLRITHPAEIPFGLLISTAYSMLDFHPLFREKLKKKNTLSNITRDSNIIYYASSGKYFVTEDASCLEKANFIFRAFACRTKALNMIHFVQKFS